MNAITSLVRNLTKFSTFTRIATLSFLSFSILLQGKIISDSYQQHLSAFSPSTATATTTTTTTTASVNPPTIPISDASLPNASPPSMPTVKPLQPPPPPVVERTGIVGENGLMTDDFVVGEFDPSIIESVAKASVREGRESDEEWRRKSRVRVGKFGACDESMREYIPCLDNVEAISRLNSMERGEKHERHCPKKGKGLDCLVPRPKGYKLKIPWPKSRNELTGKASSSGW